MTRRALVAGVILLAACARALHRSIPPVARDWVETLSVAKTQANTGAYDAADSMLIAFASRYPTSAEAHETAYWRALFTLDPGNGASSPHVAIQRLDDYLADTSAHAHRAEAVTLRRLAVALDSLAQLRLTVNVTPEAAEHAADSARAAMREQLLEKDVQRLTDSLTKTTAELDRIKRRLARKP